MLVKYFLIFFKIYLLNDFFDDTLVKKGLFHRREIDTRQNLEVFFFFEDLFLQNPPITPPPQTKINGPPLT